MKNTSRKPYIYKVTNFETGRYYIGSQCSGKKIGVNYFTSSTDKDFKEEFKNYRDEKYKIEIIKEFEEFVDPDECVRVENYIIRNYMLKKDGLCLNRFYCCNGKKVFSALGIHHSEETKQKIGLASKGRPAWNKGTQPSEETKQKMSEAHKGIPHSEEARKKMSEAHKGLPGWNKGLPRSEETRQKISTALKRKISIKNTVFDSLTDVSKYYNVSVPTIRYLVKTKKHNAVYIEK